MLQTWRLTIESKAACIKILKIITAQSARSSFNVLTLETDMYLYRKGRGKIPCLDKHPAMFEQKSCTLCVRLHTGMIVWGVLHIIGQMPPNCVSKSWKGEDEHCPKSGKGEDEHCPKSGKGEDEHCPKSGKGEDEHCPKSGKGEDEHCPKSGKGEDEHCPKSGKGEDEHCPK